MLHRAFLKAGHAPTLFCVSFYFNMAFMVWALLGPLGLSTVKSRYPTIWGAASAGVARI